MMNLDAIARKLIRAESSIRVQRAAREIHRPDCTRHGRRLRWGGEISVGVANIADIWIDSDGTIEHASCFCTAMVHEGSVGCMHVLGLLVYASKGLVESPRPEVHPTLERSVATIRARLRRNQSLDLWDLPASVLCRRYDSRAYHGDGTVGAVLSSATSEMFGWDGHHRNIVAEALDAELLSRRGARVVAPWREELPAEAAHCAFVEAVHEERSRRRPFAVPLHSTGTHPGGSLTDSSHPFEIEWVSSRRRCLTTDTTVRFVLSYDARGVHIHTATGAVVDDRCPYAIDLLHHALDYFAGHGTKAGAKRIRAALATPAWQQDVAHLDAVLDSLGVAPVHTARDAEPAPVGHRNGLQLGWQVARKDDQAWVIRAVWTRPYVRRAGLKVEDVNGHDLSAHPERLSRQDRAILRGVSSVWTLLRCSLGSVFVAAAGHPRVIDSDRNFFRYRVGRLGLRVAPSETGGLTLEFHDVTTGRIWSHASLRMLLEDRGKGEVFIDMATAPATVVSVSEPVARLARALLARGDRFPAAARADFLARLTALRALIEVQLHPSLVGESLPTDLRPVLRLAPLSDGPVELRVGIRPLPGGPLVPPGEGPEEIESVHEGVRVFTSRDLHEEGAAVRAALGDDADLLDGGAVVLLPLDDATLLRIERLQERAASGLLHLEWTRDAMRVSGTIRTKDVRVSVGGGRDWLALGGEVRLDDHGLDLQRVMEAVRTGRRFVRVDAGSWVAISDQLRQRLARLAVRTRTDKRGRVSLAPLSGEALVELEEGGAEIDIPQAVRFESERIESARVLNVDVPEALQATLRPYQAEGLLWLERLAHWAPGACLADDMGLGKTIQALGLLLHRAEGGVALVVAPTSLASNWIREAARFAPTLELRSYRGSKRAGLLKGLGPGCVLVTSYDVMRRDAPALRKLGLHTVVYDEAQALKNPGSMTARVAATVRGDFCVALSGTPVENRSEELWSLFRVLVPGLLGSQQWFRESIAMPADAGDANARGRLSAFVAPFLMRRTKAQVAKDLPARVEVVQRVELSRGERRLYNAARLAGLMLREENPAKARFAVLRALTRLRQLACDPYLVDPTTSVKSSKLAALKELVDGLVDRGEQVLVFSQFTSLLDRVESLMGDHRCIRLDGRTSQKARARNVDAFQAGEADVFLISRRAGGTGLNLTAATYVVHLDPWWNPAAEDQATDRAHRIGQDRRVTVYRLIATGTVEEGVLDMQAAKRELVDSILEGTTSRRTPSVDELLALLRGD